MQRLSYVFLYRKQPVTQATTAIGYRTDWQSSHVPIAPNSFHFHSLGPPVFEVSATPQTLEVVIFNPGLLSSLQSILDIELGEINQRFEGKILPRHYERLKAHPDNIRSLGTILETSNILVGDWELLVDGTLNTLCT